MLILPLSNESAQSMKENSQALRHEMLSKKMLQSAYMVSEAGIWKQQNISQSSLISLTLYSCERDSTQPTAEESNGDRS